MTERRADGKTTIAEALRASLSAEAESRSVEIAIRHFGFDGKGGATFSAIGKELGITREWVRQLVRRTTESVSKTPQIPALEKALRILEDRAPARCSSLASELDKAGLSADECDVRGLVAANHFFGKRYDVVVVPAYPEILFRAKDAAQLDGILATAKGLCRRNGVASVLQVIQELELDPLDFTPDRIATLLDVHDDIRWLDGRLWFHLPAPFERFENDIRKMLSATSPLDATLMRAGIVQDHMLSVDPPTAVIVAFCRLFPERYVVSGTTISTGPSFKACTLNKTEQTFLNVLKANGGNCDAETLQRECLAAGMNLSTFQVFRGSIAFIERIGKKTYALRGSQQCAPFETARERSEARQSAVVDYGWKRGKWWISYRVTAEMLESGQYEVAPLLSDLLKGVFAFSDASNSLTWQLTNRRGAGSGLGTFLTANAAAKGDSLILAFDLKARSGQAFLRTELTDAMVT